MEQKESKKNIVILLRGMADEVESGSSNLAFALAWTKQTVGGKFTHSSIVVHRDSSTEMRTMLRGEVGNAIRIMNQMEIGYESASSGIKKATTLN